MFMDNFFEANGSVSPPAEEQSHSTVDGWVDRYDAVPRASPRSLQLEPFITAPLVPTTITETSHEEFQDLQAIEGLHGQLQSSVAEKDAEHALILENDALLVNIRESLSPVRQPIPEPPAPALADDLAAVRALARARWLRSQDCAEPTPPAATSELCAPCDPAPAVVSASGPATSVPEPLAAAPPSHAAAPAEPERVGIVLQPLNAEKVALSISLGVSITDLRQAAAALLGRTGAARIEATRMFFLGRELRDAPTLLRELGLADGSVVQVAPERAPVASAPALPAESHPEWVEEDVRPADEAFVDTLLPDADAADDSGYFGLGLDAWQHPPHPSGAAGWNPTQASTNGHHHDPAPRGRIRNPPSSTAAASAASAASAAAQLVERAQMLSAEADRMRLGSRPSPPAASVQWQQLYGGRNAAPAPRPFGTLAPPSTPTTLRPPHPRDVREHTYGTRAHGPHPFQPPAQQAPLGMRPSSDWERFYGGGSAMTPQPTPTPAPVHPHAPPAGAPLQHVGLGFDDDVQRLLRAAFSELGRDFLAHLPHAPPQRSQPPQDPARGPFHSPSAYIPVPAVSTLPLGGSFDDDVQRMLRAAFHELSHDTLAHAPLPMPVA